MFNMLITNALHKLTKSFNTFLTLFRSFEDRFAAIPARIDVFVQIIWMEAVLARQDLNEGHRLPLTQPAKRCRGMRRLPLSTVRILVVLDPVDPAPVAPPMP
jgi:hypothetical protein